MPENNTSGQSFQSTQSLSAESLGGAQSFGAAQESVQNEQHITTDMQLEDAALDLDAVLDDIESTLEENAEEYVNSFVQKGGE
ncbi:ubiquitin-like protein Pup [Alloscardovia omnicolens]|jgi:pup-like protein|uniref:Prokaryotic ubiquitin-like protein Pup n=1 Tax=Alloscardovia omnicolens F0580 TaxID=1321816 RepID=U1QU06_9BIFI|nr:ubiquitin-like protein Pup [Alloscardovia omnicolens]ERH30885.1 ubiquitin-like protein Pup [Alloscardovia omnicolens F0580]KWZ74595.1 ubiquitin-like protein Pup [Alloscardovia omnicolens]MDK6250863.1 ubiquitin-like protein Pup [Alloscardovia omnicolens]MDK6642893.1 ubiquitin-like protein Pup [Alloscardovia omnicolens]MDK8073075.1 ubiquitin-like protein Pup [Alloscardovia omnicolens]